jgi:hypothetical protein
LIELSVKILPFCIDLPTIVSNLYHHQDEKRGVQFMGWLTNFFKEAKGVEQSSPSTNFHDLDGRPVAINLQSVDMRSARELVSNAATQTAQAYGIPARWLSFEVVTIADDEKAYFQLQALINHWDEYLAAHTFAFERAVIKRIREEDVEVGRAVRAVLWRVSPEAGCPYDDMPEPRAWGTDAVKRRGEARDMVNRVLYATTTPASGAVVPALMPVSADDADRAGRSTLPVKYDGLLSEGSFSDTHPARFHGFAATQPFTHEPTKNTK